MVLGRNSLHESSIFQRCCGTNAGYEWFRGMVKIKQSIPDFIHEIINSPVTRDIAGRLSDRGHLVATGQWGSCALAMAGAVGYRLRRLVLVVTAHLDEADSAVDQLQFFRPQTRTELFPAWEVLPGESNLSQELAAQRLALLADLAAAAAGSTAAVPDFIVAPVQALMQPCPNRELLADLLKIVSVRQKLNRDDLAAWMIGHGYMRLDAVEDAGDFAVRGDIVDVWPPGAAAPVRISFLDDQVEMLHQFDPESLGPKEELHSMKLTALEEKSVWPSEQTTALQSYLPADALVWIVEPDEVREQGKSYYDRLENARGIYPVSAVFRHAQRFAWAEIHQFGHETDEAVRLPCGSVEEFDTNPDAALQALSDLAQSHHVFVVCQNGSELSRLKDLLEVKHPQSLDKISLMIGELGMGFRWKAVSTASAGKEEASLSARAAAEGGPLPQPGVATMVVVANHEIFHRHHQKRRELAAPETHSIENFRSLQEGDFVVHVQHGIARYAGMTTITRNGSAEEYITLLFAGEKSLHVPVAQIHLVQQYVGMGQGRPQLSVLGSGTWARRKEKVSESVEQLAADMLEVQAAREQFPGTAYPPDTPWMKEFENAFPYQPTEDQIRCMSEIGIDLQKTRPMDRLLCGDVGYGKTELAIRSAFKVAEFGRQVAVLAPTTILVEQHEKTFRQRMAGYPFVVESVSRFKNAAQIRDIVARTARGQVDVLIGTHRLLSQDVRFKNLGLVVIDEEQRFGVDHKEHLKRLRTEVDVLTMTATPIPRTLHMSLLGIRDISNLATPPRDRRSVVTEVISFDEPRIKQAIERELARDGQIYFVHNRIWNIQTIADRLRNLAPDARIVIGHGQMPDGELEEVMHKFYKHEADILVSTTIIESGLDIASANTIFVHEAENFGLSDLHQLRGRVGRSRHRAYCYLILSADRLLSEKASRRLKAMEEYTSLGAGFKIALRDLEIRGAGNLLGDEQSGHIAAVGYELYCQLLDEAVKRLKRQPIKKPLEVNLEIAISGALPRSYISSEKQRMDLYRRLGRCDTAESLERFRTDITDAFGPIPPSAATLFDLAQLRILARVWGISGIVAKPPDVIFTLEDLTMLGPLLSNSPGSVRAVDEKTIHLRLPPNFFQGPALMHVLRDLLSRPHGASAG